MPNHVYTDIDPMVAIRAEFIHSRVSDAAFRLYALLSLHGSARTPAPISTLAEELGRSERTVRRSLAELEADGWLSIEPRYDDDGGQLSNSYVMARGYLGS